MFGNTILNLESMTREEVEQKIKDLMAKRNMIGRSGRADIYNQINSVLTQYLQHYNRIYREEKF